MPYPKKKQRSESKSFPAECARSRARDYCTRKNSVTLTSRMFMERKIILASTSTFAIGQRKSDFSERENTENISPAQLKIKQKKSFPPRKIFSFPCSVRSCNGGEENLSRRQKKRGKIFTSGFFRGNLKKYFSGSEKNGEKSSDGDYSSPMCS